MSFENWRPVKKDGDDAEIIESSSGEKLTEVNWVWALVPAVLIVLALLRDWLHPGPF